MEIFTRYAELKKRLAEIQAQIDSIKPIVVSELTKIEKNKHETKTWVLSLVSRPQYEFSNQVKSLEQIIRDLKEKEIREGIAKPISVLSYPKLTPIRKITDIEISHQKGESHG